MRKDKAPDTILRLVDNFDRNVAAYRSPAYNEAQVRKEFLDPFFEAMGWDMANRQGFDLRYRQVVHEAALRVGGTTKAPDVQLLSDAASVFSTRSTTNTSERPGRQHPTLGR